MFKKKPLFLLVTGMVVLFITSVMLGYLSFLQNTPLYSNAQIIQQSFPAFNAYSYTSEQPRSASYILNISSTLFFSTPDEPAKVDDWYAQQGWKWGCIDCGGRTVWTTWNAGLLSVSTYRTLLLPALSINREVIIRVTIPQ